MVAKGYLQIVGEDFDKTYAAVVCLESLKMSAAVAAQKSLEIWQVDFVLTYLNSILEHNIYMHLPPGFLGREGKLALLCKTIYSLMQGGYNWYWTLNGTYTDLGYQKSRADPCICSKKVGNEIIITNTFNDDTFDISSSKADTDLAKRELATIYKIKDLGDPTFILGMAIHRDPTMGSITLLQKVYLKWVLE